MKIASYFNVHGIKVSLPTEPSKEGKVNYSVTSQIEPLPISKDLLDILLIERLKIEMLIQKLGITNEQAGK